MTALLSALLAVPPATAIVVELVEPGCPIVAVQAFVPAPPLETPEQRATWETLVEALWFGTNDFTEAGLRAIGAQGGYPVEISAGDGFARIQVVQPSGAIDVARTLVVSLIRQARLSDEAVEEAKARLARRSAAGWDWALTGPRALSAEVDARSVRALYAAAFRPERVVVAVGGGIEPGEGVAAFERAFPSPGPAPSRVFRRDRVGMERWESPVAAVELRAPVGATDAPAWLAAFALGAGKEGALFRAARERLGWSYRQESILWPTSAGWVLRCLVARRGPLEGPEPAEALRSALREEVERWDELDLERAKGIARATFGTGYEIPPVAIDAWRTLKGGAVDRTALAGLLRLTDPTASLPALIGGLQTVSLEELRGRARRFLDEATQLSRDRRLEFG